MGPIARREDRDELLWSWSTQKCYKFVTAQAWILNANYMRQPETRSRADSQWWIPHLKHGTYKAPLHQWERSTKAIPWSLELHRFIGTKVVTSFCSLAWTSLGYNWAIKNTILMSISRLTSVFLTAVKEELLKLHLLTFKTVMLL